MARGRTASRKPHTWIVLLLLLVCLCLAALAGWLALRLSEDGDAQLAGDWRMRLDLTETARGNANIWLREAELGDRVDAADTLPQLRVAVILTLGEDGRWSRRVDTESLEAARSEAGKALARSLRELLLLRAGAAGRRLDSDQAAESQIKNALGISAEQYLADYGPALLPSAEELRAAYEGSGGYTISGGHIRFDDQPAMSFLVSDRLLALSGPDGTEVYEREK